MLPAPANTFRDWFSLPVFVLSLVAMGALALMLFLSGRPDAVMATALVPELRLVMGDSVYKQGQYDVIPLSAKNGQLVFSKTLFTTGEASTAEIHLDENVIRVDQNSEIFLESIAEPYSTTNEPRMVLTLRQGNVWVNAFDSIAIYTDQAKFILSHSVGSYSYHKPLNRLMVMQGYADMHLRGATGNSLVETLLPLGYQVTYSNDQLVSEYTLLESSKLRKELKQARLTADILADPWVLKNTARDESRFAEDVRYIFSSALYRLRDRLHSLQSPFVFTQGARERSFVRRAQLRMNYVLGGLHQDNDRTEARHLLEEWHGFAEKLKAHAAFRRLATKQFYAISNVAPDSPAFMAQTVLRDFLRTDADPTFLRTYLADADIYARNKKMTAVSTILESWQSAWTPELRQRFMAEFDKQAKLLDGILLAHVEVITPALIAYSDEANQLLLEHASDQDEALLSLIQSRLDLIRSFLRAYRYADAKSYLRTVYQELGIGSLPDTLAAKGVFLRQATLIADRIDYAETALRGAAEPINEADFQAFLITRQQESFITSSLREFLEGASGVAPEVILPTVSDVIQAFSLARFLILSEDVTPLASDPFEFMIQNARLLDRTPDGTTVLVDGRFDARGNGIYNVSANGQRLSGSYALEDLRTLLLTPKTDTADTSSDSLNYLLYETETEEAQRAQIIAQDLAKQLLVKELASAGISIADPLKIQILSPSTLNRFTVLEAFVPDPLDLSKRFTIRFDYDLDTKQLTNVSETQRGFTLQGAFSAPEVAGALQEALRAQEAEVEARKAVQNAFERHALLVNATDLEFTFASLNQVAFKVARFRNLPITLDGTYDRNADVFLEARHELLTRSQVPVRTYLDELAKVYTVEYLKTRFIIVTQSQLSADFPYSTLRVTGFTYADRVYDFTVDVSNNRLKDVSFQGSDSKVASMTFEEFRRVTGIPETSS